MANVKHNISLDSNTTSSPLMPKSQYLDNWQCQHVQTDKTDHFTSCACTQDNYLDNLISNSYLVYATARLYRIFDYMHVQYLRSQLHTALPLSSWGRLRLILKSSPIVFLNHSTMGRGLPLTVKSN